MNLEESNEFVKEEKSKNKKKKIIVFLIIICIISVILLFGFISFLKYMDKNTKKLFLNGERKNLSNTLIIEQDGKQYIYVEEFSKILDYKFENIEYKTLSQNSDYCYIDNGYEVISIKNDSDKVKKYLKNESSAMDNMQEQQNNQQSAENQLPKFIVRSKDNTMELYDLVSKTIKVNEKIYLPLENASKIFNVNIAFSGNVMYVYNLNYLYQKAFINFVNSGAYPELSNYYENVRALVDGMAILKAKDNKYGVVSFNDQNMKNVLAFVYTDIQYMQNTEDFFVYNKNTVGVISIDSTTNEGKTIISPMAYDELTVLDQINKLYLAKSKNKYGVLNIDGDALIPVTYEKVGLTALKNLDKFEIEETDSPDLLENKFIIVYEDENYGLYNLDGDLIIKPVYDSFGYISVEKDKKKNIENVLTIPKEAGIYGLVIEQDGLYGLYDLDKEELVIPCSCTKIYKKTKSGEIKYYIEFQDEEYELKDIIGEPEEDEEQQDDKNKQNQNSKEDDNDEQDDKNEDKKNQNSKDQDDKEQDQDENREENYDENDNEEDYDENNNYNEDDYDDYGDEQDYINRYFDEE